MLIAPPSCSTRLDPAATDPVPQGKVRDGNIVVLDDPNSHADCAQKCHTEPSGMQECLSECERRQMGSPSRCRDICESACLEICQIVEGMNLSEILRDVLVPDLPRSMNGSGW